MLLSVPGFGLASGYEGPSRPSLSPGRLAAAAGAGGEPDTPQAARDASAQAFTAARSVFAARRAGSAPMPSPYAAQREQHAAAASANEQTPHELDRQQAVRTQRDLLAAYARRAEHGFLSSRAEVQCLCAEVRALETQLATTGHALRLAAGERKRLRDEVARLGGPATPQPPAAGGARSAPGRLAAYLPGGSASGPAQRPAAGRAAGAPPASRELDALRRDCASHAAARAELAEQVRELTEAAGARAAELDAARLEALHHRAALAAAQADTAVTQAELGAELERAERALAAALRRAAEDRRAAAVADAARDRGAREAKEQVASALAERDAEAAATRAHKRAAAKQLRDEAAARTAAEERAAAAEERVGRLEAELEAARKERDRRARAAVDAHATLGAVAATSQDAEAALSSRLRKAEAALKRAEAASAQGAADKAVLVDALKVCPKHPRCVPPLPAARVPPPASAPASSFLLPGRSRGLGAACSRSSRRRYTPPSSRLCALRPLTAAPHSRAARVAAASPTCRRATRWRGTLRSRSARSSPTRVPSARPHPPLQTSGSGSSWSRCAPRRSARASPRRTRRRPSARANRRR